MGGACMKAKAQLEAEIKKKNAEEPEAKGVAVGDHIVLYDYQVIGKVAKSEGGGGRYGNKVWLECMDGPNKAADEPEKYDLGDFKSLNDIAEVKPFLPSLECTVSFRGSKVNGWICSVSEDNKPTVHFLPDAAHDSMDKTHWILGCRDDYSWADLTAGHSGDERPRNRTVQEIAEEKEKVKSYGISYVHCCRCGRGVWEDPCECYKTRAPGYACAQCGKKHSSANAMCCGERISENAQNQGWCNHFGNQYGHF